MARHYRAPRPVRHRLGRRGFAHLLANASIALAPLLALVVIGWAKSQGWLP